MNNSLMTDRRYWPLFWTQFFGAFNDNFFKNALIILITYRSYSLGPLKTEQMVALCGAIFILPYFLFSALSGQLADKFAKQQIVKWTKLAEIFIMMIGAFGFMTENLVLLLITLFLMGLHSTVFGPVKYSALPEILHENELVKGNAYIEFGTFIAILLGTILGGMSIVLSNGPMITSIGVLLAALIGIMTSRKMQDLEPVSPQIKISKDIFVPTYNIIKLAKKTQSIYLSILGISWFWFLGAAILSILPPLCKNVLHGDEHVVTLFLAIFSVGIGVGSVLCEKLSFDQIELGLVPIGSFGITLFLLDLFFSTGNFSFEAATSLTFFTSAQGLRIIIDLFFFSIFSGFFTVPLYAFIQSRSERETRSQIIAANNIINAVFMVVSSVMLMGLYAFNFSIPQIFLILAVMNTLASLYIYTVLPEFFYRFSLWILTNIMYRIKIINKNKIPLTGPVVIVSNHVSWIDWMILCSISHRPIRFVMHYSFMKIPIASKVFKDGKVIPIAGVKEDKEIMENAFVEIKKVLDEGEMICIFPEGGITTDGNLQIFKSGIKKILENNPNVPVIPVSLNGLWGSFFSRKNGKAMTKPFRRFWSKLMIVIGDPMTKEEVTPEILHDKVKNLGQYF